MIEDFFSNGPTDQSLVKIQIVSKYFDAWSRAILGALKKRQGPNTGRIMYIDLYAGPGMYADGTPSTPYLILKRIVANEELSQKVETVFNDENDRYTGRLREVIRNIPHIDIMKYPPVIQNHEVGINMAEKYERMQLPPTLLFADPWGYKGLSLRLIQSILKDWGCDCILFFNYTRINAALNNPKIGISQHMDEILGKERSDLLRTEMNGLNSYDREQLLMQSFKDALIEIGGKYPLYFRFKKNIGKQTSHHLMFVSKDVLGYNIMKEIMVNYSSSFMQGVGDLTYSGDPQLSLELETPVDELAEELIEVFEGRKIKMEDVFNEHSIGTKYIKRNYKEALRMLEERSLIVVIPSYEERKKKSDGSITMSDTVVIQFPERE